MTRTWLGTFDEADAVLAVHGACHGPTLHDLQCS